MLSNCYKLLLITIRYKLSLATDSSHFNLCSCLQKGLRLTPGTAQSFGIKSGGKKNIIYCKLFKL